MEAIVCGGSERQESVYNALQEVNRKRPGVEYVLIHDGARPYVNEETVLGVIKAAAGKRRCRCVRCDEGQREKDLLETKA